MKNLASNELQIACILTVHREGIIAGLSLRSMIESIKFAEKSGIRCQKMIVLDRPDKATRTVFTDVRNLGFLVVETDFGDQGAVRNFAIRHVAARYAAFLDGDDLWGVNWLVAAHNACEELPGRIIAHPEFNLFFDQNTNILIKPDQRDPEFSKDFLRFANCWDALCLAPIGAHREHPYCSRDLDRGFAYEDWQWNCETLHAGYQHRTVESTIIFKRRRVNSQTMQASTSKSLIRNTPILSYSWKQEG